MISRARGADLARRGHAARERAERRIARGEPMRRCEGGATEARSVGLGRVSGRRGERSWLWTEGEDGSRVTRERHPIDAIRIISVHEWGNTTERKVHGERRVEGLTNRQKARLRSNAVVVSRFGKCWLRDNICRAAARLCGRPSVERAPSKTLSRERARPRAGVQRLRGSTRGAGAVDSRGPRRARREEPRASELRFLGQVQRSAAHRRVSREGTGCEGTRRTSGRTRIPKRPGARKRYSRTRYAIARA